MRKTEDCLYSDGTAENKKSPRTQRWTFSPGSEKDFDRIMKIYAEAKGREFCVWTEDYPSEELIREDIRCHDLFCLKDEEGNIVGCIAKDRDAAVDALPFWSKEYAPAAEIARVVVAAGYENRGIARELVRRAMDELQSRGFRGIHYLVAQGNLPAIRSYRCLHFDRVGETDLGDIHYLCFEHSLEPLEPDRKVYRKRVDNTVYS